GGECHSSSRAEQGLYRGRHLNGHGSGRNFGPSFMQRRAAQVRVYAAVDGNGDDLKDALPVKRRDLLRLLAGVGQGLADRLLASGRLVLQAVGDAVDLIDPVIEEQLNRLRHAVDRREGHLQLAAGFVAHDLRSRIAPVIVARKDTEVPYRDDKPLLPQGRTDLLQAIPEPRFALPRGLARSVRGGANHRHVRLAAHGRDRSDGKPRPLLSLLRPSGGSPNPKAREEHHARERQDEHGALPFHLVPPPSPCSPERGLLDPLTSTRRPPPATRPPPG